MNELEKYLAIASDRCNVSAGDEIIVNVDLIISHDVTGPMAIEQFKLIGRERLFDPKKVIFVFDHIIPSSTVNSRIQHQLVRSFAEKYSAILYDHSDGVIHQVIAEKHQLEIGKILVGADSHTCTAGAYGVLSFGVGATELAVAMATGVVEIEVPEVYGIKLEGILKPFVSAKDVILFLIGHFGTNGFTDQAVIFYGYTFRNMSMEERMTIANMTIEMGAMTCYFSESDNIGEVKSIFIFPAQDIPVCIACPPSPGNVKNINELVGTKITQVVVGSCTNGRISDMRILARLLEGRSINRGVNLLVSPASKAVLEIMENEGLTRIIRDAGGIVTNPGCGPCFGAHLGLASPDDAVLATTNRNFPGRMGSREADIYLASPRVAAESAILGVITAPGTIFPIVEGCL